MTDHAQHNSSRNSQVKNPEPSFVIPDNYTPSLFSLKLMAKANGFTESFSFDIASAYLRRIQKRKRKPPVQRRKAMNALLMAMCFYFDPETYRVQRSVRQLAIECGLSRKTLTGDVVIDRAIRAITSLEQDYGFICCVSPADSNSLRHTHSAIFLTPILFEYLSVFPLALAEARLACERARKRGEQ